MKKKWLKIINLNREIGIIDVKIVPKIVPNCA